MGEMYKDWDCIKKERSKINRNRIFNVLIDNGIVFLQKNNGEHLFFNINSEPMQVWPSSNKLMLKSRVINGAYDFILNRLKAVDLNRGIHNDKKE